MIVFAFIPNVRYTLDGEEHVPISLFEFLENTWYNSRVYLFSESTKQTAEGATYYKILFATLTVAILLFIVGTAFNVFAAVACTRYFALDDKKAKNIYTAIVPNRLVMLATELTLLPLMFYPDIFVYITRHLRLIPVLVNYNGVSAGIVSTVLVILICAITILTQKKETLLGFNIFDYGKLSEKKDSDNVLNEHTADSERHYSIGNSKSNDQKLKSLLGISDDDDDEKNN
jgi:hypothetical protein